MKNQQVYITSNGCDRRLLDCSKLARFFRANGCDVIHEPDSADTIVFVTCSFKQSKEEECFESIRKFGGCRGELIVLGCLPEIAASRFTAEFKGRYSATKDLNGIDRFFPSFKIRYADLPDANFYYSNEPKLHHALRVPRLAASGLYSSVRSLVKGLGARSGALTRCAQAVKARLARLLGRPGEDLDRGVLRISHGCVERCAYCGIYRAVGRLRSKPLAGCVEEYRRLLRQGCRRFTILADNVGAYGLDIGSSFADLLEALSAASGDTEVRWFISQLHPRWLVKHRESLLGCARTERIDELLCAIQSGSDRILGLMNRHHGIGEAVAALAELRALNPALRLDTEVIVGFPTETEDDFLSTLEAIRRVRFDYVALFPYYDGQGTAASKMEGKVDAQTIARRLKAAMDFLTEAGIDYRCDVEDRPVPVEAPA